jgi:DNA-binding MarR family transcriptional regulator
MVPRVTRIAEKQRATTVAQDAAGTFESQMVRFVRSMGLHRPGQTPCGQPVSVAEAHALLEISRFPGLTQGALAARLRLEKSTVSRLATALEGRGWIRRRRREDDSRSVEISLTEKGTAANARIAVARRQNFERIFAAIPRAKRRQVMDALFVLVEAMDDRDEGTSASVSG